jgi:hypothetical protein
LIQACLSCHPNISLPIFEQTKNDIPGKAIRVCESVCPSVVEVKQSFPCASDPKSAFVIAQNIRGSERSRDQRQRQLFDSSIDDQLDLIRGLQDDCAGCGLTQ